MINVILLSRDSMLHGLVNIRKGAVDQQSISTGQSTLNTSPERDGQNSTFRLKDTVHTQHSLFRVQGAVETQPFVLKTQSTLNTRSFVFKGRSKLDLSS